MAESNTNRYGRYYYCVKAPRISADGEIYAMADEVVIDKSGALVLNHVTEHGNRQINLIVASGEWDAVYAASVIDGAAVAVERWEGEVTRRE